MNDRKKRSILANKTIRERYGDDFFKIRGRKGGQVSGIAKGFSSVVVGKDGLTGRQRAIKASQQGVIARRANSKANKKKRLAQLRKYRLGMNKQAVYDPDTIK